MTKERKQLKGIIFWNTLSFLSSLVAAALVITLVALYLIDPNGPKLQEHGLNLIIAAAALIVFDTLTTFILIVVILAKTWESQWCKKNKILWGLLSLFILGFIGIYIFACVGKKHLKHERPQSNPSLNISYAKADIYQYASPFGQNPFSRSNEEVKYMPQKPYAYNPYNPIIQFEQQNQNGYDNYQFPKY